MKLKILVVEDDMVYSTKLANWLTEYTEKFEHVETAEKGANKLSLEKHDVVFLDNKLPKLQGEEVIAFYKEISPESRIIAMSTTFTMEEIANCKSQNVDFIYDKLDTDRSEVIEMIELIIAEKSERKRSFFRAWPLFSKSR